MVMTIGSTDSGRARAAGLVEALKSTGVGFVGWLPDSESHFLHQAIQEDPDLRVVQVCREGEAVALCAGLYLGGQRGALLAENQGMFEFGNVLKWAKNLSIPMVMLIGYLHYHKSTRDAQGFLVRGNERDYTEPFLNAFEIPYVLWEGDDFVAVEALIRRAFDERRPVAILLPSADDYEPGL